MKKNNIYNKPQFVLQYSGVFESDKQTIVIFLDILLRTDIRRNNVIDMFQPLIVLDINDKTIDFDINKYLNNLKTLLSVYNENYNVIICSDDMFLLKQLMLNNFGKKEALLTGITFSIDMENDWKNKQGLFKKKV
jgi:hypothetical protein